MLNKLLVIMSPSAIISQLKSKNLPLEFTLACSLTWSKNAEWKHFFSCLVYFSAFIKKKIQNTLFPKGFVTFWTTYFEQVKEMRKCYSKIKKQAHHRIVNAAMKLPDKVRSIARSSSLAPPWACTIFLSQLSHSLTSPTAVSTLHSTNLVLVQWHHNLTSLA